MTAHPIPGTQDIQNLFKNSHTIAMVGLSNEPERDSYHVAEFLIAHGFEIIPINPKYPQILGKTSYPNLAAVPVAIDIVDVFRRSDAVLAIAQETLALAKRPQAFWMQLGIQSAEAQTLLQKAGIMVITDQCIKIAWQNLMQNPK